MKIKCLHCSDEIESGYSGEFVRCSCGKIFVDETEYYTRVGGTKDEDFEIVEKTPKFSKEDSHE